MEAETSHKAAEVPPLFLKLTEPGVAPTTANETIRMVKRVPPCQLSAPRNHEVPT